jgi:ATP-dependent Clp protease ATP-binding subunit ClpC
LGDEHVLLAGLSEDGTAADELASRGVTDQALRAEINIVSPPGHVRSGQIPFTPAAKRTLESAAREASNEIQPRDLVIGALEQTDGVVAKVLERLGIERDAVNAALRSHPEK